MWPSRAWGELTLLLLDPTKQLGHSRSEMTVLGMKRGWSARRVGIRLMGGRVNRSTDGTESKCMYLKQADTIMFCLSVVHILLSALSSA